MTHVSNLFKIWSQVVVGTNNNVNILHVAIELPRVPVCSRLVFLQNSKITGGKISVKFSKFTDI
jgi:hypothetical protein